MGDSTLPFLFVTQVVLMALAVRNAQRTDRLSPGRAGPLYIVIALVVLFAVFPDAVGATVRTDDERHWVALMGQGFLAGRGLLYAGFLGTVVLNVMRSIAISGWCCIRWPGLQPFAGNDGERSICFARHSPPVGRTRR